MLKLPNNNFCQQRSRGRFEHVTGIFVITICRDPIKERRSYRQRSPGNDRESDRGGQRLHMDRDENRREHRKQNISERLGQRPRKTDSQGEREDHEDPSASRWKQRNERYCEYTCLHADYFLVNMPSDRSFKHKHMFLTPLPLGEFLFHPGEIS